ncbi:MAG: hypothetical protein JST83_05360 [Bacteroidetes bacterium]|nr:hypothetical protein [Bacteroidota bacterium]
MNLPLKIATALLQMIGGDSIPNSKVKSHVVDMMIMDGVITKRVQGRAKAILYVQNSLQLTDYVKNHFGINDLKKYIADYNDRSLTRAKAVEISSNSKLRTIRTFKGFLVNSYEPILSTLNGRAFVIHPYNGTYTFIHDFDNFLLPDDVTIVGIENPENFRFIEKQQKYFSNLKVLFISRYPQSNDLIMWLRNIPNQYVHFGDFDFAGINVYLTEYKKNLGTRASFFVPENIDVLIHTFGNRELYDRQFKMHPAINDECEKNLRSLISSINHYKKGLEQEALILH